MYLRSKVSHPDAPDQAQPLAQGLGLVERQHGLPHLTAVTDRNVRHELHSSRHHRVTLASGDQADSCGRAKEHRKMSAHQYSDASSPVRRSPEVIAWLEEMQAMVTV